MEMISDDDPRGAERHSPREDVFEGQQLEEDLLHRESVERMTETSVSATTTTTTASTSSTQDHYLRPILVGYAFGPKKMSTMGIIMAEASKVLSTVVTAAVRISSPNVSLEKESFRADTQQQGNKKIFNPLTPAALEQRGRTMGLQRRASSEDEQDADSSSRASISTKSASLPPNMGYHSSPTAPESSSSGDIVFSMAGGPDGSGDLHNIVRYFRSSCSSAASFADSTATTATTAPFFTTASSTSSLGGQASSSSPQKQQSGCTHHLRPIRVSFVPLDLDAPLEEQHGGNFDAILHKLTEDILCLSKLSTRGGGGDCSLQLGNDDDLDDNEAHAVKRVNRLNDYKRNRPQCCLVDHPSHVQILMSRSDIVRVLSTCLVDVCSLSGIPVGTPRFVIADSQDYMHADRLLQMMDTAPFSYPLIAKPLIAAGTKESHKMAVVLGRSGLDKVQTPCLLQEYANHNAILFKVYVLGDIVRVFRRPSLPNLPSGKDLQQATHNVQQHHSCYVEFDSQRPYPKLADFGVMETKDQGHVVVDSSSTTSSSSSGRKRRRTSSSNGGTTPGPGGLLVTADEVRPIVDVLKKAFGLELFGFDILVTHSDETQKEEMLVVDVNYFPSYKEVSNFPSLLAQYLAQRAVEGRIKSIPR